MVFPVSWGDELVARETLRYLSEHPGAPMVLCACPRIVDRLTQAGPELLPSMITVAAPPVATARYLRSAFGERPVHITYVGECPAAADPSIDARLDPGSLFAQFAERGIVAAEQPELFESVLPPDRRRFESLPGGTPSAEHIAIGDPQRALAELEGEDYLIDLAQRLLSRQNALIDIALPAGCACAGATRGARATLVALEPPRARAPILDTSVDVDLSPSVLPTSPARSAIAIEAAAAPVAPLPGVPGVPNAPASHPLPPRRAAPARPVVHQRQGSAVPRAFAAHRTRATHHEQAAEDAGPATFPTRPRPRPPADAARLTQDARGPVIPLATEPAPVVPPPPAKFRPNAMLGAAHPLHR